MPFTSLTLKSHTKLQAQAWLPLSATDLMAAAISLKPVAMLLFISCSKSLICFWTTSISSIALWWLGGCLRWLLNVRLDTRGLDNWWFVVDESDVDVAEVTVKVDGPGSWARSLTAGAEEGGNSIGCCSSGKCNESSGKPNIAQQPEWLFATFFKL